MGRYKDFIISGMDDPELGDALSDFDEEESYPGDDIWDIWDDRPDYDDVEEDFDYDEDC